MAKTYDPAEMPQYYADLPVHVETKQSCPSCQLRDPILQVAAEALATEIPESEQVECAPTPSWIIPGLDASLCRCPACTQNAKNGTWHIDEVQRQNCLTKTTPFPLINRVRKKAITHET